MDNQQQKFITRESFDPKRLQTSPAHCSIKKSLKVQPPKLYFDQQPLMEEPEPIDTDQEGSCISKHKEPKNCQGPCIECVKAIPVNSANDIEAGDHVVFSGAVYDHHGIIKSKSDDGKTFEIIEATNTFSKAVLGLSKVFGGKAEIKCSVKKFDFEREKICVVVYRQRFPKEETIQRALSFTKSKEESANYKYDLFNNNCEHFATHCVTGQNFSVQVSKVSLTWKLFKSRGRLGISNELERNKKEFENKIICRECFEMNKQLLGVTIKAIKSKGDVQKGDIIRYSYWKLWHDAVVLEVNSKNEKAVVCSIAHYAFCGPLSYRTIKEEKKEIKFDGEYLKLDYAPPQYDVYEPEEVVKRARERLGEQLFVFFSNDSSHFARWCKLKLLKS